MRSSSRARNAFVSMITSGPFHYTGWGGRRTRRAVTSDVPRRWRLFFQLLTVWSLEICTLWELFSVLYRRTDTSQRAVVNVQGSRPAHFSKSARSGAPRFVSVNPRYTFRPMWPTRQLANHSMESFGFKSSLEGTFALIFGVYAAICFVSVFGGYLLLLRVRTKNHSTEV